MGRYGVKDVFVTLQGEGMRAGTKALFVRFTGCNLWSGQAHKRDEGEGSCARWCDTDFFKGTVMDQDDLLARMVALWPPGDERWCVLTGGEPTLQIDHDLMRALKARGWKVAIETNGTEENDALRFADHICIAPKLSVKGDPLPLVVPRAHEIKVVLPGALPGEPGWTTEMLLELEGRFPHARLFVQPQDPLVDPSLISETALLRRGELVGDVAEVMEIELRRNVKRCVQHVMDHPTWALSFQVHKAIGLP